MRFTAINFDFYGTIVDLLAVRSEACEAIVRKSGIKVSARDFAIEWQKQQRLIFESRNFTGFKEAIREALDTACGKFGVENQEYQDEFFSRIGKVTAFPESGEVLVELKKKFRLAVCSNSSRDWFNIAEKTLPFKFERVIISDEAEANKPHISIYEKAIKTIGVPKDKILHVASSQMDVKGATNAGLTVCWINRLGEKRKEETPKPDFEIKSLSELLMIVSDERD